MALRSWKLRVKNKQAQTLARLKDNDIRRRSQVFRDFKSIIAPLATGKVDKLCFQVVNDIGTFVSLLHRPSIKDVYVYTQISETVFVFELKTI